MSIKVQGQVVITNDKKGQFEQVNPGAYTTTERDALTPAIGDIVFNSEADELQVWDGTEWGSTGSANGLIQPQVEVLTPLDRAGDPELNYLKSDTIVTAEEDVTLTFDTDTISGVDSTTAAPNIILSFPTSNNLDKFEVGDEVQGTLPLSMSQGGGATWQSQTNRDIFSEEAKTAFDALADGDSVLSVTFLRVYPAPTTTSAWRITNCPVFNDDDDIGIYFYKYQDFESPNPFTVDGVNIGSGANALVDGGANGSIKGRPWLFKGNDFPNNTIGTLSYTSLTTRNVAAIGLIAITVNGEILTDTSLDGPNPVASIIAIDADSTPNPTITVDGGNWAAPDDFEQRVWSDNMVSVGGDWRSYDIYTAEQSRLLGFDGDVTTTAYSLGTGVIITFDPPLDFTTSVEVVGGLGSGDSVDCVVDDIRRPSINLPTNNTGADSPVWSTLNTPVGGGSLSEIKFSEASNTGLGFNAIRVDGEILVDSPIPDKFISKTINYDTKLTLAGDTDLNQMALGPAVMTDGVLGGSGYSKTPYTLTTTTIERSTSYPNSPWLQRFDETVYLPFGGYNLQQGFDGLDDTYAVIAYGQRSQGAAVGTYPTTFALPIPILAGQFIEVKALFGTSSLSAKYYHHWDFRDSNGNDLITYTGDDYGDPVTKTFLATEDTDLAGWLYTISSDPGGSTNYLYLYYIKVDGKYVLMNDWQHLHFPGSTATNMDLTNFKVGDMVSGFEHLEWSDYVTPSNNSSGQASYLFDINNNTYGTGNFVPPEPIPCSRVGLYLNKRTAPYPAGRIIINGNDVGGQVPYENRNRTVYFDIPESELRSLYVANVSDSAVGAIYIYQGETYIPLYDRSLLDNPDKYISRVKAIDTVNNTMAVAGPMSFVAVDDSQSWSELIRAQYGDDGNGYIEYAFFGNVSSSGYGFTVSGTNNDQTFTLTGFNPSDEIEIGVSSYWAYDQTSDLMYLNGENIIRDPNFVNAPVFGTVKGDGSFDVRMQALNGKYMVIYYIKVGGKLLVDPHIPFNIWTQINENGVTINNLIQGFDGKRDTKTTIDTQSAPGGIDLIFNPPLNVTSKVALYGFKSDGVGEMTLNDSDGTVQIGNTNSNWEVPYYGSLSKIQIKQTDNSASLIQFRTIRVDDVIIRDTNYGYQYEEKVSVETTGGQGDIVEINTSDNTVLLQNTGSDSDRWIGPNSSNIPFFMAAGSISNPPAPGYLDVAFTSMNAGTTPFTGVDATLSSRTWTLETGPAKEGPWTLVDNYEEFDMTVSQDGATPWTTGKPVLTPGTWYRVKVTYNSTAAESVESDYHTFKTGA